MGQVTGKLLSPGHKRGTRVTRRMGLGPNRPVRGRGAPTDPQTCGRNCGRGAGRKPRHLVVWLASKDSNLESPDPESGALPFGHSPVEAR